MAARSPTSLRDVVHVLATLQERQRDPVDADLRARSRSARSLSVSGPTGSSVSGRLMPLRLASAPPTSTSAAIRRSCFSIRACGSCRRRAEAHDRARRPQRSAGCGRYTRSLLPGFSSRSKRKSRRRYEHAAAVKFAHAEVRALQVGEDADRMPVALGHPADGVCSARAVSCEEWLMLMRNTSTPARNRRSIISVADEAGPRSRRP